MTLFNFDLCALWEARSCRPWPHSWAMVPSPLSLVKLIVLTEGKYAAAAPFALCPRLANCTASSPAQAHADVGCADGCGQVLEGIERRRDNAVPLLLVDPALLSKPDALESKGPLKVLGLFQFNALPVIGKAGTHHCPCCARAY